MEQKLGAPGALHTVYRRLIHRKIGFLIVVAVLILIISGISINRGSYDLGINEVFRIIAEGLFKQPETREEFVIWELRLPRVLMGIMAGMGLAIAGTAMQGILKNPLASPYTTGISAGAGFGAALAIILGAGVFAGRFLIIGNAFLFSLVPTFVTIGMVRSSRATASRLILTGIALMYLFSAATTLLMFFSDPEAVKAVYLWMVGSLGKAEWEMLPFILVTLLFCFIVLQLKAKDLNVINTGDKSAKSLGVQVERTRISLLVVSSLMTASIVSFTGTIAFIGLVAPHLCRIVIGSDNKYLIPASGLVGAALLLGADLVARTVVAPVVLPVGTITAFIGSPLFLYLLVQRKREYAI